MDNLIVRIGLPKGLALVNSMTLPHPVTLEVVGQVTPWYCSVEQVHLMSGPYIRGIQDITVAAKIYLFGREADSLTYMTPKAPILGTPATGKSAEMYNRFLYGRQRYVMSQAAYALVLDLWDVNSSRGVKTLGNFSVTRLSQTKDEEVPKKLTQLAQDSKDWRIVVQSGGSIGMGGRVQPAMAAKGLYDSDYPTGRLWIVTGLGANRKTTPGFGSEGKPFKFSSNPLVAWRMGAAMGGYLSVVPKVLMGGMY